VDEYTVKKDSVSGQNRVLWLRPDGILALYEGSYPWENSDPLWESDDGECSVVI